MEAGGNDGLSWYLYSIDFCKHVVTFQSGTFAQIYCIGGKTVKNYKYRNLESTTPGLKPNSIAAYSLNVSMPMKYGTVVRVSLCEKISRTQLDLG